MNCPLLDHRVLQLREASGGPERYRGGDVLQRLRYRGRSGAQ